MMMHYTRIRLSTLCLCIVGFGAAVTAQAAPVQGPCGQITAACQRAGFVQDGAKEGRGLSATGQPPVPASPPAAPGQTAERPSSQESRPPGEGQGPRGKPNVILVLTDDLDRNLGTLEQLPKLKDMLAGQG